MIKHPYPKRYLGLELSGAKNQKTTISVLEHYPKEKKTFLLDIYDKITTHPDQTNDQAVLETIQEATHLDQHHSFKIGVNVPLTLPPCIGCKKTTCIQRKKCTGPSISWMENIIEEAKKDKELPVHVLEATPYTQRPFEIWARYHVLPYLPVDLRFEIDETLGGNRAPLTARMHFLKKYLSKTSLLEAWPKLTVSILASQLKISKKIIHQYRKPEEGHEARLHLLEGIADQQGLFIYDRDFKKIASSLTAFDSLICALTALLFDLKKTTRPPKGFPVSSGWVEYPRLHHTR